MDCRLTYIDRLIQTAVRRRVRKERWMLALIMFIFGIAFIEACKAMLSLPFFDFLPI